MKSTSICHYAINFWFKDVSIFHINKNLSNIFYVKTNEEQIALTYPWHSRYYVKTMASDTFAPTPFLDNNKQILNSYPPFHPLTVLSNIYVITDIETYYHSLSAGGRFPPSAYDSVCQYPNQNMYTPLERVHAYLVACVDSKYTRIPCQQHFKCILMLLEVSLLRRFQIMASASFSILSLQPHLEKV